MEIVTKRLDELRPAEYNPRRMSEQAYAGLKASIERFGLVEPIVWNKRTGNVVGGHQRLKVLEEQKVKETIVVVVDLPETEEKALNVTLNNPKIAGEFTADLQVILEDLKIEIPDVFTELQLDDLFILEPKEGKTDPDDIPEDVEAKVKPGEIWQLGKHRLMCGDSTKAEDVERLMNERKADMVFTDPPYGILYLAESKNLKQMGHLASDTKDRVKFKDFLYSSLENLVASLRDGGAYYIFMSWQFIGQIVEKLYELKADGHNMLVWDRETPRFTKYPQDHIPNCELFLYGWKRGAKRYLKLDAGSEKTTIWTFRTLRAPEMNHPTQKPVALPANAIERSSKPGWLILDLFLGSGSTLIACEQLDRVCYGMEIEPKYCDVIIKRWEDFTGKKAELARQPAMAH